MPLTPTALLRDALVAVGARLVEGPGGPVAASFGDPAAEYAAARQGAGLVDLPERDTLEVSGPQRQKFLQGMLSNDVAGLTPGQGCRAALMNAKGHVRALVRVLVEPDAVALETDADRLEMLQHTLEHYRVAAPVRFRRRSAVSLALVGPKADDVLRAAGAVPPLTEAEAHHRPSLSGFEAVVVRATDLPLGGLVLHVPPEGAVRAWEALRAAGGRPLGRDALDALRVEALRPWYGVDVTEDNLLHEAGLVRECHSASKGCYLGQEIVARLEARGGNVSKALRGLRLGAPARAGATVTAEGREVGRVTTAALSPRLGPIAMGYVHRSHFAEGTAVLVDGAGATVVTFFDPEQAP